MELIIIGCFYSANSMKKEIIELDAKMQEDKVVSEDSFELQCQVLTLLLNHKITAFHFPRDLMDLENEAATTDLCQSLVAQRPPGLHTIIGVSGYREDNWDTTPLVKSMVDAFPLIEVLKMDGCTLTDDDLCRISDQLPNLRYGNMQIFS
jgi:hypothetical protein